MEPSKNSNTAGTAGFVLALTSIFLGWIPFFGWVLWVLGLIFSAIGLTRTPRGLAIVGFIISCIGGVFLLSLASILAVFGLASAAQ